VGKKSLIAENREAAFRAYVSCGGNLKETVKELKRQKLDISEETLKKWVKLFNFQQRLERADAILLAESRGLVSDNVVNFLYAQAMRYMLYLEGLTEPDNQAVFALLHVLKTLKKFVPHKEPEPDDAERMQEIANRILEAEYGIRRN
jgi:hypothetical protein